MKQSNSQSAPSQEENNGTSPLEDILRQGAVQLLQLAVEAEVDAFIEKFKAAVDHKGRRLAVRNGYHQEREILSGMGPVALKQPRVDDRRLRQRYPGVEFSSAILPKYLRRVPSLDNLVPALYLKGISTQDFPTALEAILGEAAKNLSAATVVCLKNTWMKEYNAWRKRDLSGKRYVYMWAVGIYFNVRLDDAKSCILVIMAADDRGNKELLAVCDGYRESKQSWIEMLLELKSRGLITCPSLAVGDGALGFWAALREVYPGAAEQRCRVHKTIDLLDKLPKSVQGKAKEMIHDMYLAENQKTALAACSLFIETFKDKYANAVKCLEKALINCLLFIISRQRIGSIFGRQIRSNQPFQPYG